MIDQKKIKIGLALGGGGARGLAHIGVLKELEKEGVKIDLLAGSSIGALIGAYYAIGKSTDEIEKEALTFGKRRTVNMFFDFGFKSNSILRGNKVKKYLDQVFADMEFKDCKIPFKAVATDIYNGEEVVLDSGKLADAIMASLSVPGIFPAQDVNDRMLIDGGISNPTPIDVVKNMGSDLVIAVDYVMRNRMVDKKPLSALKTLALSYELIRTHAARYKMEGIDKSSVVIIRPDQREVIDSFKFYDINKFVSSGEEATRNSMRDIKDAIDNHNIKLE